MTFSGESFAIINSIITIQSLITGLIAVNSEKKILIASLIALLISDPLINAYSIYMTNPTLINESVKVYVIQFVVVLLYLLFIWLGNTNMSRLIYTLLVSFVLYISINIYNNNTLQDISINSIFTSSIIGVVYLVNKYLE